MRVSRIDQSFLRRNKNRSRGTTKPAGTGELLPRVYVTNGLVTFLCRYNYFNLKWGN